MTNALTLADFDFDLPPDRIALRPATPRTAARLMVVGGAGEIHDRSIVDLPGLLRPGDMLVFNDTRVIPARLFGVREREAAVAVRVEALLHRRLAPAIWSAFMRPGKRLRVGDNVRFEASPAVNGARQDGLNAIVQGKTDAGEVHLAFERAGLELDAALQGLGVMPLPPYIAAQRAEDVRDLTDYQTVYARHDGSVAAPTAGLHFDHHLLSDLEAQGVGRAFVTLHVGAGTFMPVKTNVIADHKMHAEYGEVSVATAMALNAARAAGGRIVCVGTTSLRLLESAATPAGEIAPFAGETDIFIRPGYRFRAADALLTNFHLPKSTLLMLVAALAGVERLRAAYAHAIATGYRFYSYGDASLWFRSPEV